MNAPRADRCFIASDGNVIHYGEAGSGPPLLFCYGLVCSTVHWMYQIEAFRKEYRCIWFDLRGHGRSSRRPNGSDLTIRRFAQDIEELLDYLEIPSATVLGHSMGVNVVLEFCRQNLSRVDGMVLAHGTPRNPLETLLGSNLLQQFMVPLQMIQALFPQWSDMAWKFQGKTSLSPWVLRVLGFHWWMARQEDIEAYARQATEIEFEVFLKLIADYDRADATPWLGTLEVPALVVGGEKDLIVPLEQQELLHQLLPRSELVVIRNGSHCSELDMPEIFNHHLAQFLSSLESKRSSVSAPIDLGMVRKAKKPTSVG